MENINKFIPLDKSWIIRMGILDLTNNYRDIKNFLNEQKSLGGDLLALKKISENWDYKTPLNVGESGTLYRFIKFYLWKTKSEREIIKTGTLKERNICSNKEIVNWSIEKLLELDNKTSQWASASILMGNNERIKSPPFKLKLTYEAVEHWKSQREKGLSWEVKYDETIKTQALAYLDFLNKNKNNFKPVQAEDYCFARVFNVISSEEGERRWLSLKSHESNRIEETEKCLEEFEQEKEINSKDHRVVQAIVMLGKFKNKPAKISYPECVNKSWPQFWDFIEYCDKM